MREITNTMSKTAAELNTGEYVLVVRDSDLGALLDYCTVPEQYQPDITGAIVKVENGDYTEIWLTESNAPYLLTATYHSVEYYTSK